MTLSEAIAAWMAGKPLFGAIKEQVETAMLQTAARNREAR